MLVSVMVRWACWRLGTIPTCKMGSRSRDWGEIEGSGRERGLLEMRSDTSRSLKDDGLLGT